MSQAPHTVKTGPAPPTPWQAPVLIIAGFSIYNALAVTLASRLDEEFVIAFVAGGSLGEPLLLGLWAALGPGSLFVRLPLTFASLHLALLAGCLPIVVLPKYRQVDGDAATAVFAIAGGTALLVFAVAAAIGVVVRWWSRQSIDHRLIGSPRRYQFGIRYLLALTTLIAVLLALSSPFLRGLSSLPDTGPGPPLLVKLFVTAGVALAICGPTAFIPWAILSPLPKQPSVGVGVTVWIVWTCLLWGVVVWFTRTSEPIRFIISVQLSCAIVCALAGALLNAAGYRLAFRDDRARAIMAATLAQPTTKDV